MLDWLSAVSDQPLFKIFGTRITLGTLLLGIMSVFLARVAATLADRLAQRLLARRGLSDAAQHAIGKMVRYAVMLLALIVAASWLGLRLNAILTASAALLVGIGFGLQAIAQNFVAGLILLLERHVGKGDFVQIGNAYGSVVDIGLRATTVVTRDEVTIIVPNYELVSGQVVNHSVPSTNLRIMVTVGVAYHSDPAKVAEVLMRVAHEEPLVLEMPEPEVRFENFGDSALEFAVLVWIADPQEDRRIASALRFRIAAAFREEGIAIPFPQQDVHLRLIEPQAEQLRALRSATE